TRSARAGAGAGRRTTRPWGGPGCRPAAARCRYRPRFTPRPGGSDSDRGVLIREPGAPEEPVLHRVPRPGHRWVGARLVQEQLVEEQRVAGLEDRPDHRRVARRLLDAPVRD